VNKPIETAVYGDPENIFIRAEFPVDYAQFFLFDRDRNRTVIPEPGAPGESSVGILLTVRGGALFYTGLAAGNIDLTVSLHRHGPEPLLDEYEDVVEASMQVDIDPIVVVSLMDKGYIDLPPLPSETGWYRLRYHARNMDQARDLRSDVPIDSFHLQIWPAPQEGPSILQVVSARARRKLPH
jgi:hypothetical protein